MRRGFALADGFKASPPPLCLHARHKWACHARGRFYARPSLHAGGRDPLLPQKSSFRSCHFLSSWFCFQHLRLVAGIIIHRPRTRQWFVSGLKIIPTTGKPPQDIGARNVVSTLFHPGRNASKCELWRGKPKEDHFNPIAGSFPPLDSAQVSQAAQRAFKGEILARFGQAVQFAKKQTPRVQRGKIWF